MRNWKTTLAGVIAAMPFIIDALLTAYNAGTFTDKTGGQLVASIAFVIFSWVAKDHNVTGTNKLVSDEEIGLPKPPRP